MFTGNVNDDEDSEERFVVYSDDDQDSEDEDSDEDGGSGGGGSSKEENAGSSLRGFDEERRINIKKSVFITGQLEKSIATTKNECESENVEKKKKRKNGLQRLGSRDLDRMKKSTRKVGRGSVAFGTGERPKFIRPAIEKRARETKLIKRISTGLSTLPLSEELPLSPELSNQKTIEKRVRRASQVIAKKEIENRSKRNRRARRSTVSRPGASLHKMEI
tara:strand:- start:44 stop:700 length:657 start_codon:yes stop_codon:yes gene_type:complete